MLGFQAADCSPRCPAYLYRGASPLTGRGTFLGTTMGHVASIPSTSISLSHFLLLLLFLDCICTVSALWPIPSHYTSGTSTVWIAEDVKFLYSIANQVRHNLLCFTTGFLMLIAPPSIDRSSPILPLKQHRQRYSESQCDHQLLDCPGRYPTCSVETFRRRLHTLEVSSSQLQL